MGSAILTGLLQTVLKEPHQKQNKTQKTKTKIRKRARTNNRTRNANSEMSFKKSEYVLKKKKKNQMFAVVGDFIYFLGISIRIKV